MSRSTSIMEINPVSSPMDIRYGRPLPPAAPPGTTTADTEGVELKEAEIADETKNTGSGAQAHTSQLEAKTAESPEAETAQPQPAPARDKRSSVRSRVPDWMARHPSNIERAGPAEQEPPNEGKADDVSGKQREGSAGVAGE